MQSPDTAFFTVRFPFPGLRDYLVRRLIFRPKSSLIGRKKKRWTKGTLMRSFDYGRLYEKAWDTDILRTRRKER